MQAWSPGASEIPTDDRLENSSRGAKRFRPARYWFSAGLLRLRRSAVSQAATQDGHPAAILCPTLMCSFSLRFEFGKRTNEHIGKRSFPSH